MKTKKIYFLIVILVVSAFIVNACGEQDKKPVSITFYRRGYMAGGTDSITKTVDLAVASFEKRFPHITVNVVGVPYSTEGNAQMDEALEGRTDINVFSVYPASLPDLAHRGIVSDIEPYMTEEDKKDFYDNAMQISTVDGKIYAWPIWVTAVAIYGNSEIFEERGVVPPTLEDPWTWDEFVAASKQLTFTRENGTQVYGFSAASKPNEVVYLPIIYMDGGRIYSPDARIFVQNSPEAVSALQKFANLHLVENVTPPDFGTVGQAEVRAQFRDGTLAMVMDTPNIIPEFQDAGIAFNVFPPPVGETGQIITSGGIGIYGVVKVSDPDVLAASHEFARYITGADVAKDVPGWQLAPSLRRSNTSYVTDEPRVLISRLVSYGIYEPPVDISTELNDQYQFALQSILLGEKTAQEAMDEITPIYQAELDILNTSQ